MKWMPVFVIGLLVATTLAAPQQAPEEVNEAQPQVQEQEEGVPLEEPEEPIEEDEEPEELDKGQSSTTVVPVSLPAKVGSTSEIRREEHKTIVPFPFHRVCRDLDLKRQNCTCVWESTYQDGLESASATTKNCKSETEEETFECLSKLEGYTQCLATTTPDHPPSQASEESVGKKCLDFSLSDKMCDCLKDKEKNNPLKAALLNCKEDPAKNNLKPATSSTTSPSTQKAPADAQTKIAPGIQLKNCVIAALTSNCKS